MVIWNGVFFSLGVMLTLFCVYTPVRAHFLTPAPSVAAPGKPWGELQLASINLERPDDSLPTTSPVPAPLSWFFERLTPAELVKVFQGADLTPEQQKALADTRTWMVLGDAVQVKPTLEVVQTLTPEARKRIYTLLAKSNRNPFQQNPFRFSAERFEGWLANCGLNDEKRELFRRLTYHEGDSVYFADAPLMEFLLVGEEKRFLAKALSQTPALLMNLRITSRTDLNAIIAYWGKAGRGSALKPYLESLAHLPDGAVVNVTDFFPQVARSRVYTFPRQETEGGLREDCFWTSMNFFNDLPDNRYFNPEETKTTLRTEFSLVKEEWRFGDLLMLVNEHNMAMHMCVYIADEVVFTKNGAHDLQPWVLMRYHNMLKLYPSDKPLSVRCYRRKA
jgi:hypothetical protein